MTFYGLAHEEVQSLRDAQHELRTELSIAAEMQQSFLSTEIPEKNHLDIGVISVPASQMNGDYYNFFTGKNNTIGIIIADVIGKGVPAALCMSMIKYSLDSFPDHIKYPVKILKSLNRVVERNIEESMFITMLCAIYDEKSQRLTYASAGHEPGFYYCAKTNTFSDLETKGLVLGVLPDTTYNEFKLTLKKDDIIILVTDGVTESRYNDQFIERETIEQVFKGLVTRSAQAIADEI